MLKWGKGLAGACQQDKEHTNCIHLSASTRGKTDTTSGNTRSASSGTIERSLKKEGVYRRTDL